MPKVLIIEPCIVNYHDDRGGVHQDTADIVDVNKPVATQLIASGRALYTDRKDDPTKTGQFTASADMVKAAHIMADARAASAAQADASTDPDKVA